MGKNGKNVPKKERIAALRTQYDAFLEEDKERRRRNEFILVKLDRLRMNNALGLTNTYNTLERLRRSTSNAYESNNYENVDSFQRNSSSFKTNIPYKSKAEIQIIEDLCQKFILIPKNRRDKINVSDDTAEDWTSKYKILQEIYDQQKIPSDRKESKLTNSENNNQSEDPSAIKGTALQSPIKLISITAVREANLALEKRQKDTIEEYTNANISNRKANEADDADIYIKENFVCNTTAPFHTSEFNTENEKVALDSASDKIKNEKNLLENCNELFIPVNSHLNETNISLEILKTAQSIENESDITVQEMPLYTYDHTENHQKYAKQTDITEVSENLQHTGIETSSKDVVNNEISHNVDVGQIEIEHNDIEKINEDKVNETSSNGHIEEIYNTVQQNNYGLEYNTIENNQINTQPIDNDGKNYYDPNKVDESSYHQNPYENIEYVNDVQNCQPYDNYSVQPENINPISNDPVYDPSLQESQYENNYYSEGMQNTHEYTELDPGQTSMEMQNELVVYEETTHGNDYYTPEYNQENYDPNGLQYAQAYQQPENCIANNYPEAENTNIEEPNYQPINEEEHVSLAADKKHK